MSVQLASVLGEHGVKLVPDIAVSGGGDGSSLATAMVARLLRGEVAPQAAKAKVVTNGNGGVAVEKPRV